MARYFLTGVFFLTSLAAAASGAKAPAPADTIRLAFTYRRSLELEPCGCSGGALGGMVREANALEVRRRGVQNRRAAWALTGGTTFVPPALRFKPEHLDAYFEKAQFLVDGLRLLGTRWLAVDANDTLLGIDRLRALERRAGFPFLAADLYSAAGQPVFRTHAVVDTPAGPLVFTGLSGPVDLGYAREAPVVIRPAREVLRELFAQLPKGARVVVLSRLADSERVELSEAFPGIALWLGGESDAKWSAVAQRSRDTLDVLPKDRGRSLVFLEWEARRPSRGWYHPDADAEVRRSRAIQTEALEVAEARMRSADVDDAGARRNAEADRAALAARLAATDAIAHTPPAARARYSFSEIELDPSYAAPRNGVTRILRRYRAAVRARALRVGR